MKTDCNLKKMGQLYFELNSCVDVNDQKSIMLCFPFDRVIWYLCFKVHKMRKDDCEYFVIISAQPGPKNLKLATLQAVGKDTSLILGFNLSSLILQIRTLKSMAVSRQSSSFG